MLQSLAISTCLWLHIQFHSDSVHARPAKEQH